MKLIDEWNKLHKLYSVQAMIMVVVVQIAQVVLDTVFHAAMAQWLYLSLTMLFSLLGILGRAVSQGITSASE